MYTLEEIAEKLKQIEETTLLEILGVSSEVKICSGCKHIFRKNNFFRLNRSKDGLDSHCKQCNKIKADKWRAKNKEHIYEYGTKKRLERKRWAVNYLGNKCKMCGKSYPDYVYDFHHIEAHTKEHEPAFVLNRKKEVAIEELKKCILLCANCHREIHYGKNTK